MTVSRESPRPLLDALDPRLLTPTVWQELFDIFQVHYSADLPFLHPPTFLKPLRQATMQPPSSISASTEAGAAACRPPASPEFLLAFLALTARFHSKLVAHHSPPTSTRPSNPLIASEYYAAAANERLATSWTDNRVHDIERTQATLMIGLHEWGMCRGAKAWLTVGMAIRSAQAMGLQYERDLDDEPMSRAHALGGEAEAERLGFGLGQKSSVSSVGSEEEVFIQQEVRRRTFWSCYIMDRYLSSGKYRPQMLHANELRIQLPASERSFLFAEKVRTLMLGEEDHAVAGRAEVQSHRQASVMLGRAITPDHRTAVPPREQRESDEEKGRLEVGSDEGLVSRYIKILEIYGRVVQWSCAGGRRIEERPPWDPRCEWYKLRQQCIDFKASLPRQHTLTPQNTQAHISLKTSTPYTLVHTVYLLCQIMLHREYVPFLPIRCSKPEGPLDPPTFPRDRYDVPPQFWEESARNVFRAAREIMDLVRSCEEWNALVETPIVGFAIYTVAFIGVYCINFPWMDPDGYMCTQAPMASAEKPDGFGSGESKGFEAARKALEMIGQMRPRLRMANGWFMTITRMHKYFRRMKSDYRKNTRTLEGSSSENDSLSNRPLSLREGGLGGGLDEWKILERTIRDFGNLEDQDTEMTEAVLRPCSRSADALYDDSSAGTTVKSEDRDARAVSSEHPKADGGPWNAINAAPRASASRPASVSTPSSAQFRTYDSYPTQYQTAPHQPHQQQLPPPQPNSYPALFSSFRPAYDPNVPPGGPPSLTSPVSQSASTPSQASPPFDRHPSGGHGGWTPQNTNTYPMQPPQVPYSNGSHHSIHLPAPLPLQAYPTPQHDTHLPSLQDQQQHQQHHHHHQQQQQQQHLPSAPTQQLREPPPVQQAWDAYQKEAWLSSLHTRMSADDLAAFVDGGDIADWASREYGSTPGWLNTIWAAPGG
ncbi:hypothetical protein LTR91_020779 [Friedmanniomyces endolithicus]|uniref:Xylanolytic transcriptional activator regulatory domain-containing protein n=1 Tax=Friedmanniomyces endolithicus TaxID=329885 RepID=A0AAN6HBV3_9PEZI|nr:hypothetical protein LTR57_011239 [Friedmanniomyces endolithicus]KAK0959586.1 hypothetical protein LTR91_020779 [Friedmanniomyces endolithicus]